MRCVRTLVAVWCGVVIAMSADAAFAAEPLSGKELQTAVRDAVRRAAIFDREVEKTLDRERVEELLILFRQVEADTSLPKSQQASLRHALRYRLLKWQAALATGERTLSVEEAVPATLPEQLPAADQPAVLGQQFAQPPLPFGNPPATPPAVRDPSRELIEVIQGTVAPATWEVRGGNGVIRYWRPGHALVIRQSGSVHEGLGSVIRGLR